MLADSTGLGAGGTAGPGNGTSGDPMPWQASSKLGEYRAAALMRL